jgi:hypothetical protein
MARAQQTRVFIDVVPNMQEFNMDLSLEDAARHASMQEDHQALQDAIWAAEAGKEPLVQSFQGELEGQLGALRKQVLEVRAQAEHAMLLDPGTDVEEAHVRPTSSSRVAAKRLRSASWARSTGLCIKSACESCERQ